MSSIESSRPYQGHITKICGEYAMKQMRHVVKNTNSRPVSRPMRNQSQEMEVRSKSSVSSLGCGAAPPSRVAVPRIARLLHIRFFRISVTVQL